MTFRYLAGRARAIVLLPVGSSSAVPLIRQDTAEYSLSGPVSGGDFGRTIPFDAATLRRLHPTHQAFVDRFLTAVEALERDGYLLPPEAEAEAARTAARESEIGG